MRAWVVGILTLAAGSAQAQIVTGYPKCPFWETGSLMIVQVDDHSPKDSGLCADVMVSGSVVQAIRGWMPKNKRLAFPIQTYCPAYTGPGAVSDTADTGQPLPAEGEWVVVWWAKGTAERYGRFVPFARYAV